MVRPRRCRRIRFMPGITYFKPQGVPMRHLEVVELTSEEVEALRLKNVEKLNQINKIVDDLEKDIYPTKTT